MHYYFIIFFIVFSAISDNVTFPEEAALIRQADSLTDDDRMLLNAYHHSFDDNLVDIQLINALIHKIQNDKKNGRLIMI